MVDFAKTIDFYINPHFKMEAKMIKLLGWLSRHIAQLLKKVLSGLKLSMLLFIKSISLGE